MSATSKPKTPAAVPPPDAVALDAHWAAKMQRLRDRTLIEAPFRICEDPKVREKFLEAKARAMRLRNLADSTPGDATTLEAAEAAEADAQAADEAFTAASEVLMLRALPRKPYQRLVEAHPPTEDQAAEGFEYNAETFGPALVSACVVDPMTVEEAVELLEEWSGTDANDLFNAAMAVQLVQRSDLGKG